jgi:hypothetical protein
MLLRQEQWHPHMNDISSSISRHPYISIQTDDISSNQCMNISSKHTLT